MSRWMGVMLVVSTGALAQQAVCDDLSDAAAKQACKDKAAAECTMTDYWPKRRCEEKIAASLDTCGSDDFVRACAEARLQYEEVCNKADVDFNKAPDVEAWLARRKQLPAARAAMDGFVKAWGKCLKPGERCVLDGYHQRACEAAEGAYADVFGKQLDSIVTSTLNNERDTIALFAKQGRWANANDFANNLLVRLRQYEAMAPSDPRLKAAITKLAGEAKGYEAKAQAELARVRCPAEKDADPALRATLRPVFAEWLEGSNPDVDEKTIAFRMNGRVETAYDRVLHITFEDAPVTACVKQQDKGSAKARCRVFRATLRRTRVDGGAFTAWRYYSIGGGEQMLCENLLPD